MPTMRLTGDGWHIMRNHSTDDDHHECFIAMMRIALAESDEPDPYNVAMEMLARLPDDMLRDALVAVLPMAIEMVAIEQQDEAVRRPRRRPIPRLAHHESDIRKR